MKTSETIKMLTKFFLVHFTHLIFLRAVRYRLNYRKKIKYNKKWRNIDFVMESIKTIPDLENFRIQNIHIPEIEHQVGRFTNMRKIADQLIPNKVTVVEFGTYQGLGLLLLDLAFTLRPHSNNNILNLVGIDTFQGLPESSPVWIKGQFNDTSIDICEKNIKKWINPTSKFELISGRFNGSNVIKLLLNMDDIFVFHFDADLGSSTKEALNVVRSLLNKKQTSVYFLFDDWGCHPNEVPDAFHDWYLENNMTCKATKVSSTKYSRYYRIDFV